MVDNLLEIEVAYSLLQDEQKGDPIDANYHKLKTDIQVCVCVCVHCSPLVVLDVEQCDCVQCLCRFLPRTVRSS